MGSSACVNVCSLEFQAASAARSELSSLPISLSFTRSLFPTHDPAGAEDKANNELLRQLEEVVEFFVHAKRETEQREREREESDLTRSYWNCSVLNCKLVLCWANSLTSTVKCSSNNGNHFPYKMQQQINSDNNNNSKKRASQQERGRERESYNDEMSKQ